VGAARQERDGTIARLKAEGNTPTHGRAGQQPLQHGPYVERLAQQEIQAECAVCND
jgi:hypothetical protein